jgi:hypothetical protein
VKNVRIADCTFGPCHVFTRGLHTQCILKDLPQPRKRKSRRKKVQIGRKRPHFLGLQPPKKFLGSLPPDAGTLALLRQPGSATALLLPTNYPCCGEVNFTTLLHPSYFTPDFAQVRSVKAIKSFDYLVPAPRICSRSRACLKKSNSLLWPRKSSVRQLVCGAAYGLSDKIACRKETITCHS